MILERKVFLICLLYCFLSIFYILILLFPFRMIFFISDNSFHYNLAETYLVHYYLSIIFSRGFLLYIAGLVIFGLSAVIFLVFSQKRNPKLAKLGFLFGAISVGVIFSCGIILLTAYNDRIINFLPIILLYATSFSQINFSLVIFTLRNDFIKL